MSRDSRRIAANIAKLSELLKRRSPSMRFFQMHHLTGLSGGLLRLIEPRLFDHLVGAAITLGAPGTIIKVTTTRMISISRIMPTR